MATLAQQIQLDEHCGADLRMQNPMVSQAYNGFVAYQPVYHAGCLKDSHGNFCFADAANNISSPTSGYIYYLPLGMKLPAGYRPACNTCLQDTMRIFVSYTADSSQPLSSNFIPAAQHVEAQCGPRFVEPFMPLSSAGEPIAKRNDFGLLALLLCLICFLS